MAWFYILRCADGSYYVGSTVDLERRLWQHQHGPDGAAYTRRRRPVELVYSAEFDSVAAAYTFEKQVQGWNRAKREALIAGRYDDLPALSRRAHLQRPRGEQPAPLGVAGAVVRRAGEDAGRRGRPLVSRL